MRRLIVLPLFLFVTLLCLAQSPKSRHFVFDYSFTVKISDPGKPLDVWFPVAQSDQFQHVKIVAKAGDLPF
jgi:hypothetical protein